MLMIYRTGESMLILTPPEVVNIFYWEMWLFEMIVKIYVVYS
jgi:hypothetical protein